MSRFRMSILLLLPLFLFACQTGTSTPVSSFVLETPDPTATVKPILTPTPESLALWVDEAINLDAFPTNGQFVVHFSQPMTPLNNGQELLVIPEMEGDIAWNAEHTMLVFTPTGRGGLGFREGSIYNFILNKGLTSEQGESIRGITRWQIAAVEALVDVLPALTPTPVPPRVVERSPNAILLDDRQPEIRVVFNFPMDSESVLAAFTIAPEIPYELDWPAADEVRIRLQEPLEAGAAYQFSIAGMARSRLGVPLSTNYVWNYTTKKTLADASWPTFINRDVPISFRFNYPIDPELNTSVIEVDPALDGELQWSPDGKKVVFKPAVLLPPQTQVTFRFTDALIGMDGTELPPPDPVTFTTPPSILAVSPAPQGSAAPNTRVVVTFDRPIATETALAAFQITPTYTGTVSFEETSLVFLPEGGSFAENTQYTVVISDTVTGASGEPLLSVPYEWSFTTEAFQQMVSFGEYGANAQVVDANGRRSVQFLTLQPDTAVTFELFRMDLPQFLEQYSSGFRGVQGWEAAPLMSVQDAVLFKRWRETYAEAGPREVLLPDDVPLGLYVFNLVSGNLNDQLLLVVTQNTLLVKQAEGQLVTWVSNINGAAVQDVQVEVYARDGELLAQGKTNEKGVYRTQVTRNPQPLIVVARQGGDFTVSGLSNEWQDGSGYWLGWWENAPTTRDFSAYIFTDRPIYRPDQMVYFKTILREDADGILSLPASGTSVIARVRDARNNVLQTFDMQTNEFGTLHGAFQLASGAMLGDYVIEVEWKEQTARQTFKVQDYRKPDIQVSVVSDADQYVVGEPVQLTVDTRYFFGEPVANAQITINQFILGSPYLWEAEGSIEDLTWFLSDVQPLQAETDSNGRFTFALEAALKNVYWENSWGSSLRSTTWGIEVTADDGSNQVVSGFTVVKVFSAAEEIQLDLGGYLKQPNQPFTLRAGVADVFGLPVVGRDLQITFNRWNRATYEYSTVVHTFNMVTNEQGGSNTAVVIAEPGYYQVKAVGVDGNGNPMEYITGAYVFSRNLSWLREQDSGLQISADQDAYSPGETARLIIESSTDGPALLTFERRTTRHEELVYLTAPLTLVDVVMRKDYAPNIFVTINKWEPVDTEITSDLYSNIPDSRLHTATVEIQVPVKNKDLQVVLIPDKEAYSPREEAVFNIKVTNASGEGIPAEVALALVDEAIFSLSKELSGPIFDSFYAERPHIVRTYNSMALFRWLWAPGLGGGGDGAGTGTSPRQEFADTAAWFPTIETDSNGEAQITVILPDNLTSWRLTAKATTAENTLVGEAVTNILTRQPVVVRPILPRTLTAGDQVNLSALVHNFSNEPMEVEVVIKAEGLDLQDTEPQILTLEAGERALVGWRAAAVAPGEALVTVQAVPKTGGQGDSVAVTVPVRPLAVPDLNTQVGELREVYETIIPWPEDALGVSTLQVDLYRSVAGSLLTGLEYLTGFPYGCVEQTMSKALPNAVVGRALQQLEIDNPTLEADLPAQINAGLQRLYGYQHNDGGWGWWYDDATHDYQTAWVVFGLSVTAEAGYEVDNAVVERGVKWLQSHLNEMDIRTRAYALYSMAAAGYGDVPRTLELVKSLDQLDTFSKFTLALTLHEVGQVEQAGIIVDELAEASVQENEDVYWPNDIQDGSYRQKTMASSVRTTAMALRAFVKIRPGHPFEPGIVRWLMGQRTHQGWGTTNETAYAIIGLTDHLLAAEFTTASVEYSILLNGAAVASGTLGPGEPAASVVIPADQLTPGDNDIQITHTGTGFLYYSVTRQVYLEEAEIAAAGRIPVRRSYLDPETNRPIASIAPGDLVKVQIIVNMPENGAYMLVEDQLPGGLEALNESLNTTSHVASANEYEPVYYYWQDYGYNQKEVFGDRVTFFITELSAGQHTYTYFARATYAGSFIAMPAEAYAMYDTSLWGRSSSSVLLIGEQEISMMPGGNQ